MASAESSLATVSPRRLVSFTGRDADRTVVWLRGEHDASTVAALSETMARAVALDDSDLVVDLSEVQFIGAATIGIIIRTREFLRLRSRSLSLRSPSTCAGRILDVCGLADLLDTRLADVARMNGIPGALASWVAVPAVDGAVVRPMAVASDLSSVDDHHPADQSSPFATPRPHT